MSKQLHKGKWSSEHSREHNNLPYKEDRQTNGQALWLDLELKNGNHQALSYSFNRRISFNPSEGIKIFGSDVEVVISGRNLMPLYRSLLRQKCEWITECRSEFEVEEQEPFVKSIEILTP